MLIPVFVDHCIGIFNSDPPPEEKNRDFSGGVTDRLDFLYKSTTKTFQGPKNQGGGLQISVFFFRFHETGIFNFENEENF